MQRQAVCGDNFAELGGVQHEKEWSQYRALWDPERHRDRTRSNGQAIMFYSCDLFFRALICEAEERRPAGPLPGCRNVV